MEIARKIRLFTCPNECPEGIYFPKQGSMNAACKNPDCQWTGEPKIIEVEVKENDAS